MCVSLGSTRDQIVSKYMFGRSPSSQGAGYQCISCSSCDPQEDKKVKTMSKAVAANIAATPTMVGDMGGGMCAKAPGLMELLVASVLVEVDADKDMIAELAATPLARQGGSIFLGWRRSHARSP